MDKNSSAYKAAKALLKIKAVYLRPEEPFTWASGIKSPIYCDNRLVLGYPEARSVIEQGLAETVKKFYPQADALMGTATAGIAHAALTAEIMGLPMGYVRAKAKDHGRNNRIEGRLEKGDKVVVIEDLISTGGSCIEVVNALKEEGAEVLGVVSIFSYNIGRATKNFNEAGSEYHALCDLETLLVAAVEEGYITAAQAEDVKKFRDAL